MKMQTSPDKDAQGEKMIVPRRRAASEIKLLRLELLPSSYRSVCEGIGCEWLSAQPAENLSPTAAADSLGTEVWAPASVIKRRYRTLQMRYPPDQFVEKHSQWRPSADLLGNPRKRLNWYWQSGYIPQPESYLQPQEDSLWDRENVEPAIDSQTALRRAAERITQK